MLKFRKKKFKSNFTKKSYNLKWFSYYNYLIFSKCKVQSSIKLLLNLLKRIKKKFKKKKIKLFVFYVNNLIKSYKSKNARMGKGKGQLKKFSIRRNSRVVGKFSMLKSSKIALLLTLRKII